MKQRGFTLVELLAVIVILGVILAIAIPKMLNVIKQSKISSMESSVKLIARTANDIRQENIALDKNDAITCNDIAEYDSNEYASCDITFNNDIATVTLKGKGKLSGITCTGTKDDVECD